MSSQSKAISDVIMVFTVNGELWNSNIDVLPRKTSLHEVLLPSVTYEFLASDIIKSSEDPLKFQRWASHSDECPKMGQPFVPSTKHALDKVRSFTWFPQAR